MRVPRRMTVLLAVVLGALVVAGVVLGIVVGRASAGDEDRAAAVAAVQTHLTQLVAAPSSPAARDQALDGAGGAWRARLDAGAFPTTAGSSVVIRAVGLEALDGDTARVVAAARLGDGTAQRAWRVEATLTRQDGRWLVTDLQEVP
jgi:hypothetical protein